TSGRSAANASSTSPRPGPTSISTGRSLPKSADQSACTAGRVSLRLDGPGGRRTRVAQEVEAERVHDLRLLLLHPMPGVGDVLDARRRGEERIHAERQITAERDVLLAPDEHRGRADLRPVLESLAR